MDSHKEYKLYRGKELLALPPDFSKPLINGIIWERDTVIIVGKEKVGKSILAQQMAFALSSGEPFLAEYKTHKCCVLYVQAEGKLGETRERMDNMLKGVAWDEQNFNLVFYPGIALNNQEGLVNFMAMVDNAIIDGMPKPQLIIFDPLYMCIYGDLCNQVDATNTCKALRMIAAKYDTAIILIHHEHRQKRDDKGGIIYETSGESIFGSFVWRAFPDHVFNFSKTQRNNRELLCHTQRSAKIVEKLELVFYEPSPLIFELKGDVEPCCRIVELQLSKDKGTSTEDITKNTNLSYSTVRRVLTLLAKNNKVYVKSTGYPRLWWLK